MQGLPRGRPRSPLLQPEQQPGYNVEDIHRNQGFFDPRVSPPSPSMGSSFHPPFQQPKPPERASNVYFSHAHRSSEMSEISAREGFLLAARSQRLPAFQLQNFPQTSSLTTAIPPPPLHPHPEGNQSELSPQSTLTGLPPSGSVPSIRVVKNDYNQHFVDTGERPQNFIRDHEPHLRFSEYPKLEKLIRLKVELNEQRAHPPVHIQADLKQFDWSSLGCSFDVILVDPPWTEYAERLASAGGCVTEDLTPWNLAEILQYIQVDKIAETPSFCFIWCGSHHLDDGRQLLQSWGFRRCEDICWLKTNKAQIGLRGRAHHTLKQLDEDNGLFQHTKEHCLMGVKGVVRRSQDTHFIHSNIDTDIIVEEEPTGPEGRPTASTVKPSELYDIIERFCLGKRKIEIFGLDRNIRRGWVTIGREISVSNYERSRYLAWTSDPPSPSASTSASPAGQADAKSLSEVHRGRYVGSLPEIDQLRPKSPPRSTAPSKSSMG